MRNLTAERHVLDNVLAHIRTTWNAAPPRIALLGTSMGGQGALRLAFKHPSQVSSGGRHFAGDRLSASLGRGRNAAADVLRSGASAARYRHAARASAELAAEHLVLLRSDRPLARKRRSAANEAQRPGHPARTRSGNHRRRPRLRVLTTAWRHRRSASSPNNWSANGYESRRVSSFRFQVSSWHVVINLKPETRNP